MTEERTRRLLDARLAREQAEQRLPSVTAGLARAGELLWTGSRGRVDGRAPDANTQYRAGSITKVLVALQVMRLRDAGALALSDAVGDHLAAAAADGVRAVTIGQLLSHSAGLRAETAGPWWERTPGASFAELAASSLGDDAARFRPGRRHHYSNVGYALLGALIEAHAGRPWHDVIAAELLAPLGMRRTTTRPVPPHATGYAVHPHADVLLAEPEHDAGSMGPAGQLWTTIGDLAALAAFLAGHRPGPLAQRTLAEMREPVVISEQPGEAWTAAYGLGLEVWNVSGQRFFGHTGSMPGFTAAVRIAEAPGSDTVIVACNSTAGFSSALGPDLLAILADAEPYIPPEWVPAAVGADVVSMLGTWYWGPAPFTLRLAGQALELRRDGGSGRAFRFHSDAHGGWRGVDGYMAGEPLVPVRGQDGTVIALDVASFLYTRSPYDPDAPVPGGVDPDGWHAVTG